MVRLLVLTTFLLVPAKIWSQVTVERTDSLIERKSFDPRRPPADMPRLSPNENAVAQSYFGAETRVGGQILENVKTDSAWRATIRVDMVRVTLRMRVTIWLPTNSNSKLSNHEEGHRRLAERYYAGAGAIARKLADDLMDQTITGTGDTPEAAADNALKEAAQALGRKYLEQTESPCGKAQAFYDQITSHGTNPIKEDQAIEQAIARQKQ